MVFRKLDAAWFEGIRQKTDSESFSTGGYRKVNYWKVSCGLGETASFAHNLNYVVDRDGRSFQSVWRKINRNRKTGGGEQVRG